MTEAAIRAAGGLLWRAVPGPAGEEAVEVAVIHRPRYDDWSLPKGKLAPGESAADGAVREVLEETGFHIRLGRSLGESRYPKMMDGVYRPKVVRWWAMEAASGAFVATREVDQLRWVTLGQAHELLARDTDREVLARFVRGPAPSRMVLLVRHGRAGGRDAWHGAETERPLDGCGRAQADELVRLLAHFDPTEIVAADVVRCRQTVEPVAESLGLPIGEEPLLSEMGYVGREEAAVGFVRRLGGPHHTSVACTQGAVISDLLRRIAQADDLDLPTTTAAKGGTWALAFRDDRLVEADYFAPPAVEGCGASAEPNGGPG